MRPEFWLLALVAVAVAETGEPWVEEEDVEEPYNEELYSQTDPDIHNRRRRDAYVENDYEDHVRVKRRCEDEPEVYRQRRSPDYTPSEYTRVPRQVHQYEVHEFSEDDDVSYPSVPYEEMLAASAEHYHRVYAAPGAPRTARIYNPDVPVGPGPVPSRAFPKVQYAYAPVNVHHVFPDPVSHSQPPSSTKPLNVNPSFVPVNNQAFVPVEPEKPVQFVSSYVPPAPVLLDGANVAAKTVGPAPVPSEPAAAISRLSGGDLVGAAGHHQQKHHHHHHHHHHGHGHTAGGGDKHHADHHNANGGKTTKGFETHHHVDKGGKGFKTDENHRKEYEEAGGKKHKHRDQADHKGGHEEQAHGSRGAHFDEKKGHKKGHKTKGFHNKYHKDEFHKEHKFYDDFHKSGEHHRYGKFHAKHASDESGKKKAHHVNAGHDFVEKGKKGYSNKGHVDADHKGHKGGHGHEEHSQHHESHGKKGGSEGGKEWGYAKKG